MPHCGQESCIVDDIMDSATDIRCQRAVPSSRGTGPCPSPARLSLLCGNVASTCYSGQHDSKLPGGVTFGCLGTDPNRLDFHRLNLLIYCIHITFISPVGVFESLSNHFIMLRVAESVLVIALMALCSVLVQAGA